MADNFYGVPGGGQLSPTVTKDTSTTSATIELRITQGTGLAKTQALLAIDSIKAFIMADAELP